MNCIINIPQEAYDLIIGKINTVNLDLYSTLIQSVKNGIPLEQISDEITELKNNKFFTEEVRGGLKMALNVIDKYRSDKE